MCKSKCFISPSVGDVGGLFVCIMQVKLGTKRGNKTPIISITAAQYNLFYFKYYLNSISSVLKYKASETHFEGRRCIKKQRKNTSTGSQYLLKLQKSPWKKLRHREGLKYRRPWKRSEHTDAKVYRRDCKLQYNNHSTGLSIILSVIYYSEILKHIRQKPKVYMIPGKKAFRGFLYV